MPICLNRTEIGLLGEIDVEGLAMYLEEQGATPILLIDASDISFARRRSGSSEWGETPLSEESDLERILNEPWCPDI
jgi:hypothetical protein